MAGLTHLGVGLAAKPVDFVSYPMTAVFPDAAGLPIFFADAPLVGLGLWRTQLVFRGLNTPIVVGAAKHFSNWVNTVTKLSTYLRPIALGVAIGEYGVFILGLVIYLVTLRRLRRQKKARLA